ncbi:TPA: hypothetical protein ACX6QU_003493 [Photobacterium damselae]
MLRKVDVILFFEHVSRELDSLIILKIELEKLGLSTVILPIHYNRYYNTIRFRPRLVVLPYLYSKQNPTKKLFCNVFDNVIFLNLHHEQFYNEDTKEQMLPSDDYSKKVYHLSWSEQFYRDLVSTGVLGNNISVLGNPRTDTFYSKSRQEILEIKKDFEKLIFIPTTFSWALVSEEYFLSIDKIDPEEFKLIRTVTSDAANQYFEDFYKLSLKYKNNIFVLRPHPFVDINVYVDLFLSVNNINTIPHNVLICRDYNVYDWLKYADLTIGWCTTVNMEASLYKCNNIIYHPTFYPELMKIEFFKFYDICHDIDTLDDFISGKKVSKIDDEFSDYLTESFGLADGRVNERLAVFIDNILSSSKQIKVKSTLFKNLIKAIYIDIPKNLLFRMNLLHHYDSKFSGILVDNPSQKEIMELEINAKNQEDN